jgi:hypothetical protein
MLVMIEELGNDHNLQSFGLRVTHASGWGFELHAILHTIRVNDRGTNLKIAHRPGLKMLRSQYRASATDSNTASISPKHQS